MVVLVPSSEMEVVRGVVSAELSRLRVVLPPTLVMSMLLARDWRVLLAPRVRISAPPWPLISKVRPEVEMTLTVSVPEPVLRVVG